MTDCWISNVNTFWLYFVEKKFKVQKENITENALHSHEKCSAPLSWSIDRITLRPVIFIISCVCILINRLLVMFRSTLFPMSCRMNSFYFMQDPISYPHAFATVTRSNMQFKVQKYSFWLKVFGIYYKAHQKAPPSHMTVAKWSFLWNWHVSFMLNPFNFKMFIRSFCSVPLGFREILLTHTHKHTHTLLFEA